MKRYIILFVLAAMAFVLAAQPNGSLQYYDNVAVLQVWGTHFERGEAQGYYLSDAVMDVFHRFYFQTVAFSDPLFYDYLSTYYNQQFDTDLRLYEEATGLISGMQQAGVGLYHDGLQRDLTADDVMQANAFVDMILVRNSFGGEPLELGCASLASWGISTQADSLLNGNAVITRFLDWTQNSALIANPLLIVHHPSESDEQKWMSFSYPGMLGALTGISEASVWASLNMGNDHPAVNTQGLDPILLDIRRGLERADLNDDGGSDMLDVWASIDSGNHLHGTIVHALSEAPGGALTAAIENNNTGAVLRYYDANGNLPGNHLAATNHFRVLTYPTCCSRYTAIQDSLYANHHMTAKRQLRVLSGAAGLENNLAAIQYTPSTGAIIWSSATPQLPAYQVPALTFNANDLFDFSVAASDPLVPPASQGRLTLYPNPLKSGFTLQLKSDIAFNRCEIFNLRGQKVWTHTSGKSDRLAQLELTGLSAGLYLLRVSDAKGDGLTKKLLISH